MLHQNKFLFYRIRIENYLSESKKMWTFIFKITNYILVGKSMINWKVLIRNKNINKNVKGKGEETRITRQK